MGRVLVAGSINMDVVLTAPRHPARGETVAATSSNRGPGGKGANQAVAAARAGASTELIGALGRDVYGDELSAFLVEAGIDLSRVRRVDAPSGIAVVVVADGDNTIVVHAGANGLVTPAETATSCAAGDVLVTQFEIPLPAIEAFLTSGRAAGATTILNAAPARGIPAAIAAATDILVVNESEAAAIAGAGGDPMSSARALWDRVARAVIVTAGARGLAIAGNEGEYELAAHQVEVLDPTGAGDCFVGVLAAGLAERQPLGQAAELAAAAAAVSVTVAGAGPSMPSRAAIDAFLRRQTSAGR